MVIGIGFGVLFEEGLQAPTVHPRQRYRQKLSPVVVGSIAA
jgi:hypothetical protein